MKPSRPSSGFTLLEVMVAIAILGLALTAIFSSQVGAMRIGNRARRTHVATLLARCKMAEIEEDVLRDGLPAVDDHGTDECCEGASVDGYTCEWSVDRIVLPDSTSTLGAAGAPGQPGGGQSPSQAAAGLAGAASVGDFLTGGGGSGGGLAGMAMNLAFPVLKPQIEEQVRRATVTVKWQEGDREKSFDVVHFLVSSTGLGGVAPGQQLGPGGVR